MAPWLAALFSKEAPMGRRVWTALVAVGLASGCAEAGPTPPDLAVLPVFSEGHGPSNFRAHASGGEEVPANASQAQGQAIFQLSADGTEISYKLIVANIHNVTQAHIHLAPAGTNGPVVVWLYPSGPPAQLIPGRSQGILGEGIVTEANLVGSLAGQPLSALVDLIRAGGAYVNVHTSQFPPGEIRGQVH
jgi:hypothetical protein